MSKFMRSLEERLKDPEFRAGYEESKAHREGVRPTITQQQLEQAVIAAHAATPNGIRALEAGTTNGSALIFAETLLATLGISVEGDGHMLN